MPGEKILLVDDDPTILSTLTRFLTGQGYTVAAAANGEEAWPPSRPAIPPWPSWT
jgi:CheY-like chemotaxis protein